MPHSRSRNWPTTLRLSVKKLIWLSIGQPNSICTDKRNVFGPFRGLEFVTSKCCENGKLQKDPKGTDNAKTALGYRNQLFTDKPKILSVFGSGLCFGVVRKW